MNRRNSDLSFLLGEGRGNNLTRTRGRRAECRRDISPKRNLGRSSRDAPAICHANPAIRLHVRTRGCDCGRRASGAGTRRRRRAIPQSVATVRLGSLNLPPDTRDPLAYGADSMCWREIRENYR